MDNFNYYIPNSLTIRNPKTKIVKTFNNRGEFINFLKQEVKIYDETKKKQFEFDLSILQKKILMMKYLPNWYIVED